MSAMPKVARSNVITRCSVYPAVVLKEDPEGNPDVVLLEGKRPDQKWRIARTCITKVHPIGDA